MQSLLELLPPFPQDQRTVWAALLDTLVPVVRFGFEYRLNAPADAPVDLQQGFNRADQEPARLAAWLQRSARAHPFWARLATFCQRWPDLPDIHEVWLEYDVQSHPDPLPSMFLGLLPPATSVQTTLKTALSLLLADPDDAARRVEEALDWLPAGAYLSHVGLFTARDPFDIRINVSGLRPHQVSDFLRRARVRHIDEVGALVQQMNQFVDSVRLGVSLLTPEAVGLECMFSNPVKEFRWKPLFDWLVRQGLARPEEAAQWSSWPRVVDPPSWSAPWPAFSMAADLLSGREAPWFFNCRLSHVKLTCRAEHPPSAKLYGGIEQSCWQHPAATDPRILGRPVHRFLHRGEVQKAIDAATSFLLRQRNAAGWWLDFDNPRAHASDVWVTAYTAHALAQVGDEAVARQTWDLLADRLALQPRAWGWNVVLPPDADSTAWSLRLAQTLQVELPAAPLDFIREVQGADGGIASYGGRFFDRPVEGWSAAHTCVTAAVSFIQPMRDRTVPYLRNQQTQDGFWTGYWWPDEHYATTLSILSLTDPDDGPRRRRAGAWLQASLGRDGFASSRVDSRPSPFLTALALEGLLAGLEADPRGTLWWLLDEQRRDGSWPASAFIQFPEPGDVTPHGREDLVFLRDHRRIFTTATVLRALHAALGTFP